MKNQPNSPDVDDRIVHNPQLVVNQQPTKSQVRESAAGKDPLHHYSKVHVHLAPPQKGVENKSYHSINTPSPFSYKKITLKLLLLYLFMIGLSALFVVIF